MSSGLDCVECGGFVNLERPSRLCTSCEAAEREKRDDPTYRLICAYTPSLEIFDPDLEAWLAAMEDAGWPEPPLPYPLSADASPTAASRPAGEGSGG